MCSIQLLFIPILCLLVIKVYTVEINTPELVNGRKLHLFSTPAPKTTMEAFVDCRSRGMNLLTLTSPVDYNAFATYIRTLPADQAELFPISPYFMNDTVTKYLTTGLSAIGNGFDVTYDSSSGSSLYCMRFKRVDYIQVADCQETLYDKYFCEETEFNCPSLPNNNVYLHCTDVQYCEGADAINSFL